MNHRRRFNFLCLLLTAITVYLHFGDDPAGAAEKINPAGQISGLRRPTSLVIRKHRLFVGNREAGSISVISTQSQQLLTETKVSRSVSFITGLSKQATLLAVDAKQHQLMAVNTNQDSLSKSGQIETAHTPVHAVVDQSDTVVAVACLWARQVQIFQFDQNLTTTSFQLLHTIDLPFNPRLQWLAPDNRHLFVADSHGGNIARIDIQAGILEQIFHLNIHNIRGMALSPDKTHLMITHQLLNDLAATQRQRVFWGTVMENLVRSIPLEDLLRPKTNGQALTSKISHWLQYPIGQPGNAAGDPGEILIAQDGEIFICFCGTNQIAHDKNLFNHLTRHSVGRHPVALAISEDQRNIYIANQFSDTISVLSRNRNQISRTISLGSAGQLTMAQQGEALFYDARLSLDGWYSCHSCHPDGHTNGLLSENMSDLHIDSPKQVLTLLGTGTTKPWAWIGSLHSLEEQVHKSIQITMQGEGSKLAQPHTEKALVAYLETLPGAPSLSVARNLDNHAAVLRGKRVFRTYQCQQCHPAPNYTSNANYDVGISDEYGIAEFNPPSLVGISQRQRFFHDNRAQTLGEVFGVYRHPWSGKEKASEMTVQEINVLIEFLNSL